MSAWLGWSPAGPGLRAQLRPASWAVWRAQRGCGLSPAGAHGAPASDPASAMPLVVKLLYGGITEELMVRWGVMTLLLWLGWRLLQRGRAAGQGIGGCGGAAERRVVCRASACRRAGAGRVLTVPVVAFVLGAIRFWPDRGLAVCALRPGRPRSLRMCWRIGCHPRCSDGVNRIAAERVTRM